MIFDIPLCNSKGTLHRFFRCCRNFTVSLNEFQYKEHFYKKEASFSKIDIYSVYFLFTRKTRTFWLKSLFELVQIRHCEMFRIRLIQIVIHISSISLQSECLEMATSVEPRLQYPSHYCFIPTVFLPRGGFLGILGGGVPPGSPNSDPISDQI